MARQAFDSGALKGVVPCVVMKIVGTIGIGQLRIPNRQIRVEPFGNRAFLGQAKGPSRGGGGQLCECLNPHAARAHHRVKHQR